MTFRVDELSGDISREGNSGHNRAIYGKRAKKGQQKAQKAMKADMGNGELEMVWGAYPPLRSLRPQQADSAFSASQGLISSDNCI